jgi:hypothetical protein
MQPCFVAAELCGVDTVYKMGGAQAIAALAFGTGSVRKVDKIFGPGSAWVTAAKQIIAADPAGAAIDLPAGPSEVLVVADDSANARFVAADLLAQPNTTPLRRSFSSPTPRGSPARSPMKWRHNRTRSAGVTSSRSPWPTAAAFSCPTSRPPWPCPTTMRRNT